jgi:hypothetical protein
LKRLIYVVFVVDGVVVAVVNNDKVIRTRARMAHENLT